MNTRDGARWPGVDATANSRCWTAGDLNAADRRGYSQIGGTAAEVADSAGPGHATSDPNAAPEPKGRLKPSRDDRPHGDVLTGE